MRRLESPRIDEVFCWTFILCTGERRSDPITTSPSCSPHEFFSLYLFSYCLWSNYLTLSVLSLCTLHSSTSLLRFCFVYKSTIRVFVCLLTYSDPVTLIDGDPRPVFKENTSRRSIIISSLSEVFSVQIRTVYLRTYRETSFLFCFEYPTLKIIRL